MKSPDHDPLDMLLDQSLQSASLRLDGEKFSRQLAVRIANENRRIKLVRLIPIGMGVLAAIIVTLFAPTKIDFSSDLSTLVSLWETTRPALTGLMQSIPGAHNLAVLWGAFAALAIIFNFWFVYQDSHEFLL